MDKTSKYQCTMKLLDSTVTEPVTAIIFAKTADKIPQVSKVGSIIRLHRTITKEFKNKCQINCDVNVKGAWILFDPSDGVTPVRESGTKHTLTSDDRAILSEIRKFSKSYFAKNDLRFMTLKDAAEKKPRDFDTLCMVMEVKKKGVNEMVKLCDAQKVVKLEIPVNREITVTPGEVIRIRSANYTDDTKFDSIELSEYSNVLRVPAEYKSAKELMSAIEGSKASETVKAKLAIHTPHLNAPMVGSKIIDSHKQTKTANLKELYEGTDIKSGQKYFKVHVGVSEVTPKSPKDWIQVYDKKNKKSMTLDEAFKSKKSGKLPAGLDYYLRMNLYAQDKTAKDARMYILFVSTLEEKCPDFIKLDLGREYPTDKAIMELKRIYKTLTNPFVTLDLMLEIVDTGKQKVFHVVDTALTI